MTKRAILFVFCALPAAPAAYADVDLMGKRLQVYAELHGSLDYYDRGPATATVLEPAGVEITSNSSHIGFKGEIEFTNGVRGVWKFESEFDLSGDTDIIEARHRYVGLSTTAGSLVLGTHSTPLKETGSRYTLFGDTVGDRTGILGQTSTGDNQFNQRARSMMLYRIEASALSGSLIYSPDFAANSNPDTGDTGTSSRLLGAGIGYRHGGLDLMAAVEKQSAIDSVAGRNARGYRTGIRYQAGNLQYGGVYEVLKDDGYGPVVERRAWAVHAAYRIRDFTLAGQYIKSEDSAIADSDDGAALYGIGVQYHLHPKAQIYLVYASLSNDADATYQLARSGHGQAFAPTVPGVAISAVSVGAIYAF